MGTVPVPREDRSLRHMMEKAGAEGVVVVGRGEARWEDKNGNTFRFHPNLSALRIKELASGGTDALVTAANLKPGDRVLDCTLGLGADSIVSAHAVGEEGEVIGLESQPVIAALVDYGLNHYLSDSPRLNRAMRSVRVVCADYREELPRLEDGSFDVVLFDPMFRQTVKRSSGVQALKVLANPAPLDRQSVSEAKRVARKRVVLKERLMSGEFERLGFRVEKEASNHAFGIIETRT
ncbi:putative SAM-dependent methyltransferase [Melghirimyces profundicolus]|uniref:Putative SAM-dependent methyltransferase n=1 Tax=Melghirimyces profundicolus TaxID=1242148 RepID=A0A2T6BRK5_9BACL|nr:class I SAM-dependent methyltransferase [Melghirimyces profundicolus]PTX58686.1 putative SAM-dependent methyltransferase [Melghirimyces profundicolus]